MRRLAVPALVAVAALALVALLIFGVLQTTDDSSLDEAVARGDRPTATSVRLPRLDGGEGELADYRGQVVLVNFFASWCGPCEDEAPVLRRAQRALAAAGGTVLGISVDDTREDSRRFLADHRLDIPVLRDVGRRYATAMRLKGVPETFLVDADGRIVAMQRNAIDQRWIDEHLTGLLSRQ